MPLGNVSRVKKVKKFSFGGPSALEIETHSDITRTFMLKKIGFLYSRFFSE
jgi:hypothetical protein